MKRLSSAMKRTMRRQVMVSVPLALVLLVFTQSGYAIAFVYGVCLMLVNAVWLASRLEMTRGMDARSGERSLYAGAAMRFVALIVGLMLAQWLGLHLLIVAAGIFVAQAVVFGSALKEFKRDKGESIG